MFGAMGDCGNSEGDCGNSKEKSSGSNTTFGDLDKAVGPTEYDLLGSVSRSNWMGDLWKYFKHDTLADLCLLGSHDTLSYDLSGIPSSHDTLPAVVGRIGRYFQKFIMRNLVKMGTTQSMTITEQFEAGVRYFDLRITRDRGVWYGVHTLDSNKPVKFYLDQFRKVLEEHPFEVCVLTVTRHGVTGKGSGSPLDVLSNSKEGWQIIVSAIGHLMVNHTTHPMQETDLQTLIELKKRLYVFVDGWEVVAGGDPTAGPTSMVHVAGGFSSNVGDVKGDREQLLRDFKQGCKVDRSIFCLLGLNSSNSLKGVIWSVLGVGEKKENRNIIEKLLGQLKGVIDPNLQKLDIAPGSLLSYAQLSLYYMQYTLMEILEGVIGSDIRIPNSIVTDAIVKEGNVRVGWLIPSIENVLESSAGLDVQTMEGIESGAPIPILTRKRGRGVRLSKKDYHSYPSLQVKLGVDLEPACHNVGCKSTTDADAARITFDMFRYCILLCFIKKISRQIELDPANAATKETFSFELSNLVQLIFPTYVDSPYSGRCLDPREIVLNSPVI